MMKLLVPHIELLVQQEEDEEIGGKFWLKLLDFRLTYWTE